MSDLLPIVRRKMETGELPRGEEALLILNLGLIGRCEICGGSITGIECVAELHDGRKLRFHPPCFEVWYIERNARGEQARFVTPQPDWEGNNPEVLCEVCGEHIQPFESRYVLKAASFHPRCYDQMPSADGAAPAGT